MAKVTLMLGNDPQGDYTLDKPEHTVGRSLWADILINDLGVSRLHAIFVQDGDGWKIVDQVPSSGTFVNGERVFEKQLKHNDRIVLGKFSLLYRVAEDERE